MSRVWIVEVGLLFDNEIELDCVKDTVESALAKQEDEDLFKGIVLDAKMATIKSLLNTK